MKNAITTVMVTAAFLLALFSSLSSYAAKPKAEEVLAKLVKSYKNLKSFREEISLTMVSGGKEMKQASTLIFSRPNKVSWKIKGEDAEGKRDIVMCSDGKYLFKYNALKKEYTKKAAPSSPAEMSSQGFGFDCLILNMLDGGKKYLVTEDSRLQYRGRNGDNLIILATVKGSGDNEEVTAFYIDPDKFLLRRMDGEMKNNGRKVTIKVYFRYTGLGSSFNDRLFRFTPPAGAREKGL